MGYPGYFKTNMGHYGTKGIQDMGQIWDYPGYFKTNMGHYVTKGIQEIDLCVMIQDEDL